jgi:Right handed beta helix region
MKAIARLSAVISAMLVLVFLAAPAHATMRAFVSANGSDTTDCSVMSSPCQTFSFAVGQVFAGGEVTCLSGGDFGSIVIDHSITIDCGAGVGIAGAIVISGPGIIVKLRNLTLNSNAGSSFPYGVTVNNVSQLLIENCHVFGANGGESFGGPPAGIYFGPTTGTATLQISDSVITGNVIPNSGGIVIRPASGAQANVTITHTKIENNSSGIIADASAGIVQGFVTDSVVSGNANNGISVVGSNAAVAVGNSEVSFNFTGLSVTTGGQLLSYENNRVAGNTTDGAFTGKLKQR